MERNPLIPTGIDVLVLAVNYGLMAVAALGVATLVWALAVPQRRRQLALLVSGRPEPWKAPETVTSQSNESL